MSLRFGSISLGAVAVLSALLFASNDAAACGGCFHREDQPETTVVTGHRMAFSISQTQTVLWDQIAYAGNPADFAWVLPIKPGAHVEIANDAWFEALDTATSTRIVAPQLNCVVSSNGDDFNRGCGCGSLAAGGGTGLDAVPAEAAPPPVTITHEGSIGPYETVTLHANVQGSLTKWLTDHKYAIDDKVQPIIDAYTADGFDFIALRLLPDKDVKQMKPVRVVSPGSAPTLPLRMVSAGTGANVELTLFVIGEGRWEAQNFPNGSVDAKGLSWDFNTNASNYAALRQVELAKSDGRTWLNTYAKKGSLLSSVDNPTDGSTVSYAVGVNGQIAFSIGELYLRQGFNNDGDVVRNRCLAALEQFGTSNGLVVDLCSPSGDGSGGGGAGGSGGAGGADSGDVTCGSPQIGQIDARNFACDQLTDLSVALTGMHPQDVRITRLEANLPHAALAEDLNLQAAKDQGEIENWMTATTPLNPPCQLAAGAPMDPGRRGDSSGPWGTHKRTEAALLGAGLAALAAAFARRVRRPLAVAVARSR